MDFHPIVRVIEIALPQAFLLYTVDKIVASLIKQVGSFMGLLWSNVQTQSRLSAVLFILGSNHRI